MKRVIQELAILGAALLLVVIIADPVTAVIWELDCDSGAVFTWQAMVTDSAGDPIPSGDYELIYCYYEDSAGLILIGCCTTTATVGTPSPGSKNDKAAFGGSALAELTYAQPIWEDTTKVGHFPKMTVRPDIWLELTFNGEVMSPLTLVTSVPNSGTAQRVLGDIYTAPGRALIVEPPQASSGMVDLLGNDTVASVGIYRPTDDILPMIIMEVTDTTSILAVFDTSRNTTISITGEGAGTFEDLVWSKTGFKFPDLTVQTTAWIGGGGCWVCPANYTYLAESTNSVGIGTSTPSEKLEVAGNLLVTGKATIGSGHANTNWYAFVAGQANTASGYASTVGGGRSNTATYFGDGSSMWGHSTVAGGRSNTASADYSTVGGGQGNTASLGSSFTAANGGWPTVSGGRNNYAGHFYSSIGGGYDNDALSQYATVGGGSQNTAGQEDINDSLGAGATVGGGSSNTASGCFSLVGGGESDTSKAVYGGVSAGYSNLGGNNISDTGAYVGGGYNNSATAKHATVGGGYSNTASGDGSTVGGGSLNVANASSGTVAGGSLNLAGAEASTVGGGKFNKARGTYSVVCGGGGPVVGDSNLALGDYSAVGGGQQNIAGSVHNTIGGGKNNTTGGSMSTVCGGFNNLATGHYSVVPGGTSDTVTSAAWYSMAFGRQVYVNNQYRVVFFDGRYSGRLGLNRDDRDGGIDFPIHVGDTTTNGNGAYLSAGGTWTNGSSREFKENFQQLDGQEVLNRIDNLPMESWEYKGTGERHIWPCAEDFHEQFDVGVIKEDGTRDIKYLAAGDVAGVALVGVQELYRITQELQKKTQDIEELRAQLGEQEQLKVRVAQLEALVETIFAQRSGSRSGTVELALDK